MNNLKSRFELCSNEIRTEFNTTAAKLMSGDTSAFSKSDKVAAGVAAVLTTAGFSISKTMAAGDIISQVSNMIAQYYPKIAGLAAGIAAICILIACIWTMFSPSSHSSQVPIGWIKKIIVILIVALSIGGIITLIENLTSGMGY